MPVTVIEHWYLTDDAAKDAFGAMQQMDDLVEDNAHASLGWDGHARFFRYEDEPNPVLMRYYWQPCEQAEALLASEEPLLRDFMAANCSRGQRIEFADELHVGV